MAEGMRHVQSGELWRKAACLYQQDGSLMLETASGMHSRITRGRSRRKRQREALRKSLHRYASLPFDAF